MSKMDKLKHTITKFSWVNAFKTMTKSRCNPWDNPELDMLEGYKFFCFIFLMIAATSVFQFPASKATPWAPLEMKKKIFFTIVMSCNQATDVFLALSAFIACYRCMQIYEANGGKITIVDALKVYGRKYLRLAPLMYIVFFFGWVIGPRLSEGPNWTNF